MHKARSALKVWRPEMQWKFINVGDFQSYCMQQQLMQKKTFLKKRHTESKVQWVDSFYFEEKEKGGVYSPQFFWGELNEAFPTYLSIF